MSVDGLCSAQNSSRHSLTAAMHCSTHLACPGASNVMWKRSVDEGELGAGANAGSVVVVGMDFVSVNSGSLAAWLICDVRQEKVINRLRHVFIHDCPTGCLGRVGLPQFYCFGSELL